MVDHEHLMVVIMSTSFPEMLPDSVYIMDLGEAMILATLVSMMGHEHLIFMIMIISSWDCLQILSK